MLNAHIATMMEPIRQRRVKYENSPDLLVDIFAEGAKHALATAKETMEEIYGAMGLLKAKG
jgi:hypothetical protein